ncbi:MAG TPA: hypothetical protein PKD49_09860 [Hyphomicrobium sp.]|nr:hypothetical protein [Hyphomicrobium sp.]
MPAVLAHGFALAGMCALFGVCADANARLLRHAGAGDVIVVAQAPDWSADIDVRKTEPAKPRAKAPAKPANTTIIQRSGDAASTGNGELHLVALLTADGQQIDEGVVWRVFQTTGATKPKLVTERREASPELRLQPGDYTINAAFGRANLTRKISVKAGAAATERFVLNAGGLRVNVSIAGKPAPEGSVTYAIYSDDREAVDGRGDIMTAAKPGLIIRLNAGIYHIVSTYGDANAKVEADVTVEAGKLTEASVVHQAAKAAFKLVTHEGGEALPDTHWTIQTQGGETVKESVGALPTHVLAPGDYTVLAKSGGHVFRRQFSVKDGEIVNVEVVAQGAGTSARSSEEPYPEPDFKNP